MLHNIPNFVTWLRYKLITTDQRANAGKGSLECVRLVVCYAGSCHSCVHCHAPLCISPPRRRRKSTLASRRAARVCRTEAARGQKSLSSNYRAQSHIQIVRLKMVQKLHNYFFMEQGDMVSDANDVCNILG